MNEKKTQPKQDEAASKPKSDGEVQINAQNPNELGHHHHHHHIHWDNPIEFLMTCIGYAVGLGNVWRFPFLCYKNGGTAFVIAFVVMLFTIGLPLFFLELTIAQFSKNGPLHVWKITPLFRGIGLSTILMASFINLYYNVIIAYSIIYLIASFIPHLPWTDCQNWWNTDTCYTFSPPDDNSTYYMVPTGNEETPSKQFFNNYLLEMSSGIGEDVRFNWKLAAALLVAWLIVFLCLFKGIKSLGKVSYVTAIFPYVMLASLIVRGVTLPGSMKGIVYFIGTIDFEKLATLKTWIDAASQVFFCLGIGLGSLINLGKHNKFNYNHQRTSVFVAVLDGVTGIIAGFAVFSVIGFMSEKTNTDIDKLAVAGPGLSFIVYPEALSLMPFPWIWCVFFFLMMITIGLGSQLSCCESVFDTTFHLLDIKSSSTKTKFRFIFCIVFFLLGIPMTMTNGYYIFNLVESYSCGLPIIFLATLETISLCWFYGTKRLKSDIELMLKTKLNFYWKICFRFFTPVLAIVVCIITILSNTEVVLGTYRYPMWAHIIGWSIVAFILSPLLKHALLQIINAGVVKGLYKLTQPQTDWRPVFDRVDAANKQQSTTELETKNEQAQEDQKDAEQKDERKLTVAVLGPTDSAAANSNLISISIGVKYGEAGPSTNLNFAFDPDYPQDLIL